MIPDNLDNQSTPAEHTDAEAGMTHTDVQICRQGAHMSKLEWDKYSSWTFFRRIIHILFC